MTSANWSGSHAARSRFAVGLGYAVSLALAVGLVLLLHRGALPVLPATEVLKRALEPEILAYFGLWLGVLGLRSWRWTWLVAPMGSVPRGAAILVALVGHAALLVLPYRTGEAIRPILMRRYTGIGFFEISGTVAAERVIDAGLLALFTLAGLYGSPPRGSLSHGVGELTLPLFAIPPLMKMTTAALLGSAGLVWVATMLPAVRRWAEHGGISERGRLRTAREALAALVRGLAGIRRLRTVVPFVAVSVAYWLLNACSLWWLLIHCGESQATLGMACTAMGLLGLGIVVPTTPGYFGSFQLALYTALALYVSADRLLLVGMPMVFFAYAAQVGLTFLVGGVALLVLGCGFPAGSPGSRQNLPSESS